MVQVKDTKVGMDDSNDYLPIARSDFFTISELIGENQQGVKVPPLPSPRLNFMNNFQFRKFSLKEQEIYKPFIVSKKIETTNKIKLNKINKIREVKILG